MTDFAPANKNARSGLAIPSSPSNLTAIAGAVKVTGGGWCGSVRDAPEGRCRGSADAPDVQIARVDDLVEAVGDETCCRHAQKPTAQHSRLVSEGAE
jgi:hypothetical protein